MLISHSSHHFHVHKSSLSISVSKSSLYSAFKHMSSLSFIHMPSLVPSAYFGPHCPVTDGTVWNNLSTPCPDSPCLVTSHHIQNTHQRLKASLKFQQYMVISSVKHPPLGAQDYGQSLALSLRDPCWAWTWHLLAARLSPLEGRVCFLLSLNEWPAPTLHL